MMGAVREWLTAVVSCAAVIAVAERLAPEEGTVRKLLSLTGGLVLLIVLLRPLKGTDLKRLSDWDGGYQAAMAQCREGLEAESAQTLAQGIEARAESYISDKAARLGIDCTAKVETRAGADGIPLPYRAELSCGWSAELSEILARELGIPEERQVFS